MRNKIIRRFAAGTIGVCFTYALIRLPFAAMDDPSVIVNEWTAEIPTASAETTLPATLAPVTEIPLSKQGGYSYPDPTEAPNEDTQEEQTPTQAIEEIVAEQPQEEVVEDSGLSDSGEDDDANYEQNDTSGDVPTLEQFLSMMNCGGCRHNCLLFSPRCMKGRSKAESAAEEYYEIYGA